MDSVSHLSDSDIEQFWTAALQPEARQRVVRHLLSGCEGCLAYLLQGIPPAVLWTTSTADEEDAYDAAIDRAIATTSTLRERWAAEEARRDDALEFIEATSLGRFNREKGKALAGTWARAEVLLRLGFEMRYQDPVLMVHLLQSALEAAHEADPEPYGRAAHYDLLARVFAELANACRIQERWSTCERSLFAARANLYDGTGNPMVRARIDDVEASYLKDDRELASAEALLNRVYRIYHILGERHLAGRALVKKGSCRFLAGQPLEAASIFRHALRLLDSERDPGLATSAQHNLLDALVEAGQLAEAERILADSGLREAFADEPLSWLRLRWVEGKILAGRDRLAEAEEVFRQVREGFWAHRLELPAAVVGLEEARAILQQGDKPRAAELAQELRERALERKLPKHATHALMTFEVTCRQQAATPDMAERVGHFLDRLQNHPALEWQTELMFVG